MLFTKKSLTGFILILLVAFGGFQIFGAKAQALSPSSWQPGRVIDDAIFYNSQTYDANQVQAFLNSQMPTCDTNHDPGGGYNPPFVCLKDYVTTFSTISGDEYCPGGLVGGTKSSAQIIAETAVNCGINPQSLLVLLQKEQSLVTDSWPWPLQYEKATGFSCPDTAPCDPQFAGFANQVYYGARQFKKYVQRPDLFPNYRAGRTSRIYYNPNSSCGYSDVFVQTQATSSLYIYTPYQPNASALANLYGSGDSCGAYGNRNFWRMFNDWFGPTVGPLVRSLTSPNLYYTDGSKKYSVSSMELAEQYGLNLNDVRYMHQEEINLIPNASYLLSQVVKSDNDTDEDGSALYLVSKGKRIQFSDMQQFADFGFSTSDISYMPIGNIYRMQADSRFLSNFIQAPSLFIYKVSGVQKQGIFELSTFNSLNPSGNVTSLSEFTLSGLQTAQPIIVGDAILKGTDQKLWLFQNGNWYYIPSMSIYSSWGFSSIKNFGFNSSQATPNAGAGTLTFTAQRSDGTKYLMNSVNRINNNAGWGFSSFSTPLDSTIDRISNKTSIPISSVLQSSSSTSLYVLESGKKRLLPNMDSFLKLGYQLSNIVTVHPDLLASIPTGYKKLVPGALVKDSSGKTYVVNSENKLYIPDVQTFVSYGFNDINAVAENSQLLSLYPSVGNLQMRFKIGNNAYLMDATTLWTISGTDNGHFGISGSTPNYNIYMLSGATSQKTATRFIKNQSSSTIYYLENGQKRPISSWAQLENLGGQNSIIVLSDWGIQQFTNGPVI